MAVSKLVKSGGLAAMAAALAVLALPASAQAQERGHGRWGGRDSGGASAQSEVGGDNGRGWRGNRDGGGRGRSFRNEQSVGTPAPQAQARSQRDWSRGERDGGRWNRGNDAGGYRGMRWGGRDRAQAPVAPAPQVQTERRRWSGSGQWQGRDRNVVRERDSVTRWRGDGSNWRGDGNRWRGDGSNWRDDGNRWRNDSDNRWRNNDNRWRGDRHGYARNWNRDWRRDNRYDWRGYRSSNRNVYRPGAYYAPYRNYSYRRLSAGFYLDTLFFGSRYWINDPWQYRLPPADGPYRWVRYYDDALLVDIYSGEVVDVIYDFFW